MWRSLLASIAIGSISSITAAPVMREAPNPNATAANQRLVSGNACGPAALLNAFRFGNPHWQRAANVVTGDTDRERILRIIREIGMRPSKQLPGRPRWSRRGISVTDLRDMANEMSTGLYLPKISDEVFFTTARETPQKLLRRTHQRLEKSLAKGLPPVISIRRHALRRQRDGSTQWVGTDAHFVTLTAIPRKLPKNATSFPVRYIDPLGGEAHMGVIRIPEQRLLTDSSGIPCCLEAAFPEPPAGKRRHLDGEKTAVVLAAAIGRW